MAKKRVSKQVAQKKKAKRLPRKKDRAPNYNDVLIRLIDAFYNLAQSGNLVLLIVFAILVAILIMVLKLPQEDVSGILGGIGSFFSQEKFYLFPMGTALSVCVYALFRQRNLYVQEINRITDERKRAMHGIESGELQQLEHHNSSGFDVSNEPLNGDDEDNTQGDR